LHHQPCQIVQNSQHFRACHQGIWHQMPWWWGQRWSQKCHWVYTIWHCWWSKRMLLIQFIIEVSDHT
jgi:hypothetical protein